MHGGVNFTTINEKYPTEQTCKEAAKAWLELDVSKRNYACIPAPSLVSNKPCADPSGSCPLPQYDNCTYTETLKICQK